MSGLRIKGLGEEIATLANLPWDQSLENWPEDEVLTGMRGISRAMEIVGVAERLAHIAAIVAATTTNAILQNNISAVGAHVLGGTEMPNAQLLRGVADAGLHIHQFVGA